MLYSSTQHAREWITPEVNSRLLKYFVNGWRNGDQEIRKLLQENEYWFVIVANPDGYQYTFASEDTRLWRKNLRDNNANGTTEVGDGVDPNRNYPEHFKYDEEGSSSVPSSDTYRGPSAGSEAETQAIASLYKRVGFVFHVNWHSAGQWLLYPEGWQTGTPTADDPIYFALSGNLDNPAIEDFHPGLSSDVLYVTNGETTDFAHAQNGALAWTPELSEGCDGCGFVFPDDEALVQAEFERNLPFALDVAKSAQDPDDPVSHLGIDTKPFYFKSDDTYKTGVPGANFTFAVSYGDPQEIRVLAKKALQNVDLKYQINGGKVQSTNASKFKGGDRYGVTAVYYEVMRGEVRGTKPGDQVTVWFEGKEKGKRVSSDSFTYTAAVESKNDVLILANEDYTGASPVYANATAPNYLSYYQDALAANDIGYDVYDVDASGRTAATALGVLSHYDAVVWYTGNDIITREPGWGGGNMSRIGMDQILNVRAYLNEGGKALWTGKHAGLQHSTNQAQLYDPTAANAQCATLPAGTDPRRCLVAHGSGDLQGDVLEYWFGGFLLNNGAGLSEDRHLQRPRLGHAVRLADAHVQRGGQRAERRQRELVHRDERHPAARRVPAVRELGVVALRPPRRAVRPAHGRLVRVLPDRGRVVQDHLANGLRPRRRRQPVVLDVVQHRGRLGLPLRRGGPCRHRQLDDAPGHDGPHVAEHRPELPGGLVRAASVARASTRPSSAIRRAPRPAPPERGTRLPVTRAAGSSGASTSAPTRADRSTSASPTRATGRRRASASSWTT